VVDAAVQTWSAEGFVAVRRGGRILVARLGERVREAVEDFGGEGGAEQFKIDARDFLSARERGGRPGPG